MAAGASRHHWRPGRLAAWALLPVLAAGRLGAQDGLPAGEGATVVRARCLSCHGSDLITAQRLTETGWDREIDKMVRWGARLSDVERPVLRDYLARHFSPAPATSGPATADGETIFNRACLSCHERDLTAQQRLTPAGWTREVEKMMRWGARVSDVEKEPLVNYLAALYGVR